MVLNLNSSMLALCFTFMFLSCSDAERDNPLDPGGINYNFNYNSDYNSSSSYRDSSLAGSSSSTYSIGGGSSSSSSSSLVSSGRGNDIGSYRTINIGTQKWMAENLDYDVEGSKCYDEDPENCTKYGRLYDWSTAMALPSSCNSNSCSSQIQLLHRGICPFGWHIPSSKDWDLLITAVGGNGIAGKKLKATSGWNSNGNGTDEYGFSALPGGYGISNGYFLNVGYSGYWWSASEYDSSYAYYRRMYYNYENAYWGSYDKGILLSVRCVQD